METQLYCESRVKTGTQLNRFNLLGRDGYERATLKQPIVGLEVCKDQPPVMSYRLEVYVATMQRNG